MSYDDEPSFGKAIIIGIGVFVAAALLFGVISWSAGWFGKAGEVTGADNVEKQHTQVIETFNSVQAAANNACAAGKASKEAGDPVMLERPEVAYGATVRSQVADYNRRQANIFESKLVGPAGYPRELPTPAADENWCGYAAKVTASKN
ncbi:Uncharacterised protein (plasmid) [Tsukamurella tyrosinosolvens]|uniref:Uncharacterized protein n=1 Tax=Tsukamurella tyrosinosolvens TaxID=57704 RepID=A0A1H4UHM6_TSUTY|nr:hypothetical protein [Tsukamurella tyrosinosolvens]KXO92929.1 hypothetical protein AXK58_13745 [Tsukamurella tyrosinosolvens]SEC67644.1 hypothetical protein SAMN04489793_2889 [Tsukamurella tyrosinosolvens]VEH94199.1 Uncharacterised protein [Tsukamurella tyrosinosolvens]